MLLKDALAECPDDGFVARDEALQYTYSKDYDFGHYYLSPGPTQPADWAPYNRDGSNVADGIESPYIIIDGWVGYHAFFPVRHSSDDGVMFHVKRRMEKNND